MINILSTPEETVSKFAKHLELLIYESTIQKNNFNLALSGGNTPQLLFKELKNNYLNKIDWSYVHFFWGDERCVNPDSFESNYGNAKRIFFEHTNIPEENIHRIHGESNPFSEAKRYSRLIFEHVPQIKTIPQFDLIILGIGTDGHTASIFPNQMEFLESENICEVAQHPESKQERITLTGKIINNAKNVIFLVTGVEKSIVVSEILKKENNYKEYPASYINPEFGNLVLYLDKGTGQLI